MIQQRCPNCDASLSGQELADGWCETCGKRLPESRMVARLLAPPQTGSRQGGRLSRVADWLGRISLAGMLFVLAGCVGIPVWSCLLPLGHLAPEQQDDIIGVIMVGLVIAFISLLSTWLVAKGLKVLSQKDT